MISDNYGEELEKLYNRAEAVLHEDICEKLDVFRDYKKETIARVEERITFFKNEYGGASKQMDELLYINSLLLNLIKYSL